jgi:polysaccharide export outer membrane protein
MVLSTGCAQTRGGPIAYDVQDFGRPDAPRPASAGSEYLIATGDLLSVTVYQVEPLSKEYRVDLAGNIAMPLIGDVAAVGRSADQLEAELTRRLGERYLRNPNVTVAIQESTNNNITLEGGVRAPGIYPVNGPTSLIQAVALGRGIDPQAGNPRRVAIFRRIKGERMAAAFDLVSIRRGEMGDPDIYPGDIVVVESNSRRGLYQDILQSLPLLSLFRPF